MGGLKIEKRPIGLWAKLAPEPEETVPGLLLRIAEMQMHASTARTVKAVGVRRSAIARAVQPDINLLAEAILQDPTVIAADTPRADHVGRRRFLLRNQVVGEHIEFARRRLCPACIESAPHHRFWWDVIPITSCPRHGLNLVEGCMCGKRFGWLDGSLLKCARREDGNHGLARTRADPQVLRKDRYLLSRFAASEAERVPILDALTLEDAVQVMKRIGAASEGYSRTFPTLEALKVDSILLARGFEVLADGRLDELLTKIYSGHIEHGGSSEHSLVVCYGWFYRWLSQAGGANFSPLLARTLLEHAAARFPIPSHCKLGELPVGAIRKISLSAAAARAGMSAPTMRRIGAALGSIRPEKRQGVQLSFRIEDVERITRDFKGAMSLKETMKVLGTSLQPTIELIESGLLVPALCMGGKRRERFFRPQDIDAFLKGLARDAPAVSEAPPTLIALSDWRGRRAANIAERTRAVLDGRLRVRAIVRDRIGLQGLFVNYDELREAVDVKQLTVSSASARMRMSIASLRSAINAGLINDVSPGSDTLPTKAAAHFAERFMMLNEIRERLGGDLLNLRKRLKKAGFDPDPNLQACNCAAYLRAKMEPLVRKVEAGDAIIGKGEAIRTALAREAKQVLERATSPVPTEHLIEKIRLKMPLDPSDGVGFRSKLWFARKEIVSIKGSGWWLRARPYLGIQLPADGPVPSQRDFVDSFVLKQIANATAPLTSEAILADLHAHTVILPSNDGELFLRSLALRHQNNIIRLTGLGYWDRSRPYEPALYEPRTWKQKNQSAAQRTGLWMLKLIKEAGRPLSRAELTSMFMARGLIPVKTTSDRSLIECAVDQLRDDIVYLNRTGYWLARKPWPTAGYRPARPKRSS